MRKDEDVAMAFINLWETRDRLELLHHSIEMAAFGESCTKELADLHDLIWNDTSDSEPPPLSDVEDLIRDARADIAAREPEDD